MRRAIVLLSILLAAGLFQAWFLDVSPSNIAAKNSSGTLTDAYTEALAMGQSSLLIQPDAHSTWESRKFQILDASYFENRVYLCFGITPFAVLMVPWHRLTGTFLSQGACILILTQIGYLMYGCALWLVLRYDRRPKMDWLLAAGLLATIVGSSTWPLMARPAIYEIEAACAYACFASAVACLVAAHGSRESTRLLLGCAAFFAGITIGCRPNYFPAVALIAGAIGYLSWKSEASPSKRTRALLLCWAPLAVVGVALAAWNYERFSSIFEFGYGYTGFAQSHPDLIRFSPGNVLYNLNRYLVGGFRLSHYFPFIDGVREVRFPLPRATHEPVDQLYGSLILFPVLAYAFLPCFKEGAMRGFLLLMAAANLLLLSGYGFGTYRYPADYLGIASFAAGLGICCIPRVASRFGRIAATGLLVPVLCWSVVSCVCEAASIGRTTNLMDVNRAGDFAALSYPFNKVAFLTERLAKSGPRAIRLSLALPTDKYGRVEPIVVDGDAGLQDFIYFYYTGPGEIQVGFEATGYGGLVSGPRKLDYSQPHMVDISLGSFLPPDHHPLLQPLSNGEISFARGFVHVEIDHQTFLEGAARLHQTRSRILIGESPDDAAFGERFTGKLLRVERPLLRDAGIYPNWRPSLFGPVALTVKLKPMPVGSRQPLVCLGFRPAGGILFVESLPLGRIRLGWETYNGEPVYSQPIDWSYGQSHRLEFHAGSLLPPLDSSVWAPDVAMKERVESKRFMRCILDGREAWSLERETPDVSPSSVVIGRNDLLQSNIADTLNGEVTSVAREAW